MSFKNYFNKNSFECKLPGTGETISISPLTTGQMKKVLIYQDEKNPVKLEEVIDEVISSSVLSDNFDINNIYVNDRYFLLIELRKISKGNKYTFQYTCPNCKSQAMSSIDIGDLEVKERKEAENNTIEVTDEVYVTVDHITRKEEKDAYSIIDMKSDPHVLEGEVSVNTLAAGIKSVTTPDGTEDNLPFEDKKFIIENSTISSLEKIRD